MHLRGLLFLSDFGATLSNFYSSLTFHCASVQVQVLSGAPKCVDERCNAENAARKCGVFAYNALLLEWKSCKNSIFQNFSFALREATFLRCALPNLWSGVVRTPRLKNKENQQPLYHPPLFWRVRQRLFLSDGSRTHNLKWAL